MKPEGKEILFGIVSSCAKDFLPNETLEKLGNLIACAKAVRLRLVDHGRVRLCFALSA